MTHQPRNEGESSAALARSSAAMASGTLVSRVLGLVRVVLLAGVIGLLDSPAGNAWQTANTLPNTLYILLAGGVLNVVFVPALTRAAARADGGRDFSDRLITLALASLFAITVVVTLAAALITKLYALSWSGDQLALAVTFAYLCLPQVFCYGLYTVLGQILNSLEKFGWYMWAPVVNNIVSITGIVIFGALYPQAQEIGVGEWTGGMIWWLAGTATLGVLLQALVLIWPVYRSGFRWRPRWGFRGVGLGAASNVAMWTFGVIAVSQLGMWLSTNVLNRATDIDGSVAGKIVYESAFLFFILPHSIITLSLVTALFTKLSKAAAVDDLGTMRSQYEHGLRLLGVAIIPISVAMFLLAPAVTTVLLFGNSLDETLITAFVTMPMLIGLVPYAVYMLSGRVFSAFQDGRTPFKLQVIITTVSVIGIIIAALLPPVMTAIAIGAAQAAGQLAAAVIGVIWVNRRLGGVPARRVMQTYSGAVLAALAAALPTAAVGALAITLLDGRPAAWVALFAGGPVFLVTYVFLAHRFGVRELSEVAAPLLARFGVRSRLALADEDTPTSSAHTADTAHRKERSLQGMEPGVTLGGRYVLEELLAQRDDDLDYWSARDSTLDRMVAATLVPATGEYEELAHSVQDGARRTAGVDDPRLVRVMDMGIDDGVCWIVEEGLAEAESLASLVASAPLPPEEARRVIGEAASGLESARRRGLHHLFLSPHALLRSRDGTVKVSGVAVAAAIEQVEDIGSVESSIIDSSDLVALLYTALTGRWPGEEMEGLQPARRLADGSLPAPSELVAGVPGDLDALCRQVLANDYDPRTGPSTPGELAQQLAPWPQEMVTAPDDASGAAGGDTDITDVNLAAAAGSTASPETSYYRTTRDDPYPARPDDVITDPEEYPEPEEDDDRSGVVLAAGAGGQRSRSGAQSVIVLLVIVALVAGGIYFVSSQFLGDDDEPSEEVVAPPTQTVSPTTDPDPTSEPEEPEDEDFVVGPPVEIAGITSYDPEGDGDERNDLTEFAIDGDFDTEWYSRRYLAPNWGNLKSGVGLILDLGDEMPVAEVDVHFSRGDNGAEIYVGNEATREDATLIGSADPVSGTWEVAADEPVEGRYVLIWFTRAWTGPDGERVHVSEVEVRSIE